MKNSNFVLPAIVSSAIASGLNFFISLLIVPFVTERIGTEAYGFISLANNFVSYATILTLALNSYATRYISVEYHRGDMKQANRYYSTVVISNAVTAITIIVLGSVLGLNIETFISVPIFLLEDVKILFIIIFINFAFTTFASSFATSAYLYNKLTLAGLFKSVAYVVEIIAIIYLFSLAEARAYYIGIAYILFTIVILASNYYIFLRFSSSFQISIKYFSFSHMKELILNGIWNSLNGLGNILNSGLDLLITNLYLSASVMGELAIVKTIGTIPSIMNQLISHVFQPMLLKSYAADDKDKLLKELYSSMKISGLFVGVFFCTFFSVGIYFYELWIPSQNIYHIYILTIVTLLSSVLEGIVGPLYYIYTLTVKNKVPCIVTLLGGVLNIVGMLILLRKTSLEEYAVVLTTAIIMIFINMVTNPIYMAKCLNVKWYTFYPIIFRYIIFLFFTCIVLHLVIRNIVVSNIFMFLLACAICVLITSLIYFLIMYGGNRIKIKYLFKM